MLLPTLFSNSSNPFLTASGSHLTSPSLTSRVATLSSSPTIQHHSLSMFAHPIPAPSVSLPSVGGAVAPTVASSPFIGDSLFIPSSSTYHYSSLPHVLLKKYLINFDSMF